ncbi:ATP-dependent endonuclease [Butyricimonas sp. Marseille-P3923]|uniref:ATP-dependent nuclease n=1 Tax=Butyricimonas sp. Marseille-P3923 TaxID=1987504 RepID=UPI000C08BE19|nr:ATP-binding protein [Butyricimonas sp. Marseille-P3923]
MIEEISCCGYRGFAEKQTLKLAIPNGVEGSGLTVLVGPNGGGKSTLVECFSKIVTDGISFTEGKRNKLANDKVAIEVAYDGKKAILASVVGGGSETEWSGPMEKPKIYYLPSRRVFNPYFGKNMWNRDTFIHNPENSQFRGNPLNNFTYRLFDANKHSDEFNKVFWRILGKELHWTIDQDDSGNYYVKIRKGDSIYHNSDGLGEGIVSLLFIVDALFEAKPDELIVIDEPELSLHPQLQARLLNEILRLTKNIQVVISTHSPNMISIDAAINNGVIARVHEGKNSSVISCIDDKCRDIFNSFSGNIYNPHTIGSDARACFFAEDGFIITEGQEDVILFPKILEQLGITRDIPFFGFGAGGANNIKQIAYILKCLDFSCIGAIFDGDKQKEYDQFREEYDKFGYRAWIIPADDIRDKPACARKEKGGLLNHENMLKAEFDRSSLKQMFEEIIEFSSEHR